MWIEQLQTWAALKPANTMTMAAAATVASLLGQDGRPDLTDA